MPFIEIQSVRLKCEAYTPEINSLPSLTKKIREAHINGQNTTQFKPIAHKITTKVDAIEKNEPAIAKKLPLEFPFNLLSKQMDILVRFKLKLQKNFDADLVIRSDCYEIKRRQRKIDSSSSASHDSNQIWIGKLESFLVEFEQSEFEQKTILKSEQNKTYWEKLNDFLTSNCVILEINLAMTENRADFEGTKDAMHSLGEKLVEFESKISSQLKKESEYVAIVRENLPKNFIDILRKEKYFEKCKQFDQTMRIKCQTETSSLLFTGLEKSIEVATQRLNNLLKSLQTRKVPLDWYIADFIQRRKEYIDKILSQLNCVIEVMDLNEFCREGSSMLIVSLHGEVIENCSNIIKNKLQVAKYDVSQNSVELLKNSKFDTFLKNKVKNVDQNNS